MAEATDTLPQPDEDQQRDHDMDQLKALCLLGLGRNFDSVQIIATRHGEEGTINAAWGEGNYYARVGSVREWLWAQR